MKLDGGPYVPIPLYTEDKSSYGLCLKLVMNDSLAEYLTLSDITYPSLWPGSQSALV